MILRVALVATGLIACASGTTAEPATPVAPSATRATRVPDEDRTTGQSVASPAAPADAPPPDGPFSRDRIREIVRANYDRVGECYAAGLSRDPKMKGTIEVHLAIGEDGTVVGANAAKGREVVARKVDDRLTDDTVVRCVEQVFTRLRFPPTGRGLVNMIYPVVLAVE